MGKFSWFSNGHAYEVVIYLFMVLFDVGGTTFNYFGSLKDQNYWILEAFHSSSKWFYVCIVATSCELRKWF